MRCHRPDQSLVNSTHLLNNSFLSRACYQNTYRLTCRVKCERIPKAISFPGCRHLSVTTPVNILNTSSAYLLFLFPSTIHSCNCYQLSSYNACGVMSLVKNSGAPQDWAAYPPP